MLGLNLRYGKNIKKNTGASHNLADQRVGACSGGAGAEVNELCKRFDFVWMWSNSTGARAVQETICWVFAQDWSNPTMNIF